MNAELKKKLEDAVASCATKSETAKNALDAMQFAQSAVNLSNGIVGLENLSLEKQRR